MKQTIRLDELDQMLSEHGKGVTYDAEAANSLNQYELVVPDGLPDDPFSGEYIDFQWKLYEKIAGKPYSLQNESIPFDVDEAVNQPYPYNIGGTLTVGTQYLAIGSILRAMDLPRGSRVIEFGAGWGNTSIALAKAGLDVTVVDLEPRFCDLITRRAAKEGVSINAVNADFLWAETYGGPPFDAVLFFECFHHCHDHLRLLRALHKMVRPNGRVFFAGEPISDALPMPWGVRLSGEALWATRNHGWLELGFSVQYFEQALCLTGWQGKLKPSSDTILANVWEASQFDVASLSYSAAGEPIFSPVAHRDNQGLIVRNASNAWGFHGPYVTIPEGRWLARAHLRRGDAKTGAARFDVCSRNGGLILSELGIDLARHVGDVIEIPFAVSKIETRTELRLFCEKEVSLSVDRVDFVRA
ncbi:hypothetical protein GCM10027093_70090 [Paraburkholderia jirisanensis]